MHTLTTRTLPQIDMIHLFDADAGMNQVGSLYPTGCNSGHMTLHLTGPEYTRYMINDAHQLVAVLGNHGYRLDSESYMSAATAIIDRSWAEGPMRAWGHHHLEVTALYNAGCNLVFDSDLTTLAAAVHVVTVGTDNQEIRLNIYKINLHTHYHPQQPVTDTTWNVRTLTDMRKVLDIHGYELSYAAEETLMKVLIPIP